MMEMFLEGERLDINQELSSLLTFAIDDIKDFSSRNCTFSKTIVLPGTANNNKQFGNIFNVQVSNPYVSTLDNVATNFNASVGADCLIFQNRLQVFKGTLRLLEIVITDGIPEYEVAVFGELGGFVAALGAKKLEDLDFSAYDTVWNAANVTGSWEDLNASGVTFPLIDYGGVSTNKIDYDLRTFRPALFVRQYIQKIMSGAGYTFSCDLFNTSRFKKLLIPNPQKNLQKRTTELMDATGALQTVSPTTGYVMLFGTRVGTGFTYSAGTFTYAGATSTMVDFAYNLLSFVTSVGNSSTQLNITRNGTTIHSRYSTARNNQFIGNFSTPLDPGDTIEFTWSYISVFGSPSAQVSGSFTADSQEAVVVDLSPGDTIDINSTIPRNILQKDFISSIVKLFNLYIYEDKLTPKKLFIKPYIDYYDLNPSGVTDWTYKVDRSRSLRLKPMGELNSRYYEFKFKPDNDYFSELYRKTYNENYGDFTFDSAFEFINDKTSIELIFSSSLLIGYTGADKIVTTFYKKNAGVEERFDTNIRILQSKKVTGVDSWKIKDGNTVLQSGLTTYGYAGHYDDPDAPANDIHFGVPNELYFTIVSGAINVTQFNVYWSSYMAEITDKDSKLWEGWLKLNNADIFNLDFSKLVYIDGVYWRVNKIEDWNANEPDICKAELLKVINLVY